VDFIADYLTGIRARRVFPAVQPGYMKPMIPDHAPEEGEAFQEIFEDFQRIVLPGVIMRTLST
jgi:aromatic-L-amino-acid decarboxylase